MMFTVISASASADVLKAAVREGVIPQTKAPNGWIPVHFIFSFNSKTYTVLLNIKAKTYNHYSQLVRSRADPRTRRLGQAVVAMELSNEGKVDVLPLAKALYRASPDKSREGLAAFILSFVQVLPYEKDALTSISDETWRSPLQTLVDTGVDCEDSSILFASLMAAVQQDSALVIVPGHMMVAIPGKFKGKFFDYEKKHYFFAETTSGGWSIGDLPPSLKTDNLKVFSVNAYYAGKRKQKRIERRPQIKTTHSGGGVFFLVLLLISALAAWFAWDFGWFSSNEDDSYKEDFFNDHEDSWK